MPFIRYKPWKVFSRYNTRLFKDELKLRNKDLFPPLKETPGLAAHRVKIHDPTQADFFHRMLNTETTYEEPAHLVKKTIEDHVLYKAQPCYLFDGTTSMTDGVDQACALANAIPAREFPAEFYSSNLPDGLLPDDFEWHVRDAIMHGERYDATMDPLPLRQDPVIFWQHYTRAWGTPVAKRASIILTDIVRKVLMFSAASGSDSLHHLRLDRDAPINAFIPSPSSGLGAPWVLRQQPSFVVQSMSRGISPLADHGVVEKTRMEPAANIYPISPLIDLPFDNLYNDCAQVPKQMMSQAHLNCVLFSREQDQKYPWSRDELAGNAILHCLGAAVAEAARNQDPETIRSDGEITLQRPVVMKAVQLVNGRLDMVLLQLNTVRLRNGERADKKLSIEPDGEVKNLVWLEKSAPLYKPKPFYENMDEVHDLDMDTARKFAAFLLYQ